MKGPSLGTERPEERGFFGQVGFEPLDGAEGFVADLGVAAVLEQHAHPVLAFRDRFRHCGGSEPLHEPAFIG
jgi:hypothetical protein